MISFPSKGFSLPNFEFVPLNFFWSLEVNRLVLVNRSIVIKNKCKENV